MEKTRYSFILRIWFELEPNPKGYAPGLRGSLQQAGSDQLVYFDSLDRLKRTLAHLTTWQDAGNAQEPPFIE